MNHTLVATGSVGDVATKQNLSLAHAFVNVKIVVLCDRSGSMVECDAAGGKARFEVEDELVARLQKAHPGQLLLASFNDAGRVHTNGILPSPSGGTLLLAGLKMIQDYLVADVRAVLISDGEPYDDEKEILDYVRANLVHRLDCMFAGPEGSAGAKLMQRIAAAARGVAESDVLDKRLPQLAARIELLLGARA